MCIRDRAGADLNGSDIEHHAKCIERSHKMLKLLDSAVELDVYKRQGMRDGVPFFLLFHKAQQREHHLAHQKHPISQNALCLLYTSRCV